MTAEYVKAILTSFLSVLAITSTSAYSETFCIEPDGSSSVHQINFFGSQDGSKVVPLGIIYSNWTHKTECFDQVRFWNFGVDGAVARDVSAGGSTVMFEDAQGKHSEGGHGYYVMVASDDSEKLVHKREHVYEFLPLKIPVADPKFRRFLVLNFDDDKTGIRNAPNEYVSITFNDKSEFDYNGGLYKTNCIKFVVETADDSGNSLYNSVNIHLDKSADAVDYLGPGVYQFEKIAWDGLDIWLSTVEK